MMRFWDSKLSGAPPLLSLVVRPPEGFTGARAGSRDGVRPRGATYSVVLAPDAGVALPRQPGGYRAELAGTAHPAVRHGGVAPARSGRRGRELGDVPRDVHLPGAALAGA